MRGQAAVAGGAACRALRLTPSALASEHVLLARRHVIFARYRRFT